MMRHADLAEQREHMFRDAVVEHALAVDRPALLRIERRRIVLELLDQGPRFGAFVEDLGFAFVDLAATGHGVHLSAGTKRITPATGDYGSTTEERRVGKECVSTGKSREA